MKIIELRAENFKRLTAVRIRPDGTLCQITGRNAQGKSSVLDAVWAALGGKEAAPAKPIRKGAASAVVTLDLGDLRVTRKWTADDKSSLVVESKEGLRYPSPQSVLDGLVGRLSFDPLAFSRMDERRQAQTLRELVGLDLRALNAEYERTFAQRTEVGRVGKALDGQIAGIPPVDESTPDEEVSVADLAARQRAAMDERAANDRVRAGAEAQLRRVHAAEQELRRAEAALEAARKARDLALDNVKREQELSERATAAAGALVDPDVDAITAELQRADRVNAAVRQKKMRAAKLSDQQQRREEYAALTAKLKEIEQQKVDALAAAKFPVDGLSVDGDAVTFRGLPLEQASSAEQLRVGLAMGAALNPKLRVVLVRDGSLLDADGLKLVAEWAAEHDMQVIMERVADGKQVGVVIEDGEVAGAAEEAPAEAAAGA